MANNFKATLDDLPEILAGISFQLDRIANILQLTDPEETKSTTTHIQKMIEVIDRESETDEFPQTKNRKSIGIRAMLNAMNKEGDDYDF